MIYNLYFIYKYDITTKKISRKYYDQFFYLIISGVSLLYNS